MLDFKVKKTHKYTLEKDGSKVTIVEKDDDKAYLELYWGKGYGNSMFFTVTSLEEAKALAVKCLDFLNQNSPVFVQSSDEDETHL